MKVQNVKISSCPCLFWCGIDENTETKQQITISATGRVWFKSFKNGNNTDIINHSIQLSIGKDNAKNILNDIDSYFNKSNIRVLANDAGIWNLTITYIDGSKKKLWGNMCFESTDDIYELCNKIRKIIPINNLLLLDGIESY